MFLKIVIALVILLSLFMFYRGMTAEYRTNYWGSQNWYNGGDFAIAIVLIIACFVSLGIDYCFYRIEAPQKLKYYKTMVVKTKELIGSDKKLNMTDMEMSQELADVISNLEGYKTNIRIAKISPWVIFRPLIDDEDLN